MIFRLHSIDPIFSFQNCEKNQQFFFQFDQKPLTVISNEAEKRTFSEIYFMMQLRATIQIQA